MKSVALARAAVLAVVASATPTASIADTLPTGFVHLSQVDPSIRQDIRYAGSANFLGRPAKGYKAGSCILTKQAADALSRVQEQLQQGGLSLVVFDCYRPAAAVADFVAWTREGGPPDQRWHPKLRRNDLIRKGYIASRSAHSRGSTVDVGVVSVDGAPAPDPVCGAAGAATIDLGTGFDCFDPTSRTSSLAVGEEARRNRKLLLAEMSRAGFRNYAAEWWHFTLRDEPFAGRTFDFPVTAP